MTHILMSWFKESTKRRKISFLKETIENADLHKAVWKKTMTTQKYDFAAPLKNWFFWSKPCKIEVMITSLIEMLELPEFDHKNTSAV